MLVVEQVKIVVFGTEVIAAVGALMFCVMTLLAVAVQPFAPVTVTV